MRAARVTLIAIGALAMGYAVLGALTDHDVHPVGVAVFLAAALIVHDAVLLPVALGVGMLIGRFVPVAARPPVRYAAVATLSIGVVALPLTLGYGRVADNPSILPLAYGRGWLLLLAIVWVPAALVAGIRARRRVR